MRDSSSFVARSRVIRTGVVVAALALASIAGTAAAQEVPSRESALEIRKRFLMDLDTLHSKFVALSEAIPAEQYSWRPAPGVRSIGEAFMHVASEYYVYTPMSYGATRSHASSRPITQGRSGAWSRGRS